MESTNRLGMWLWQLGWILSFFGDLHMKFPTVYRAYRNFRFYKQLFQFWHQFLALLLLFLSRLEIWRHHSRALRMSDLKANGRKQPPERPLKASVTSTHWDTLLRPATSPKRRDSASPGTIYIIYYLPGVRVEGIGRPWRSVK